MFVQPRAIVLQNYRLQFALKQYEIFVLSRAVAYLYEHINQLTIGRVASITGQARSTLTRENGQPTDSNLAQPSSVILLRARTPICASVF